MSNDLRISRHHIAFVLLASMLVVMTVGCAQSAPTPTAAPQQTNAPAPTNVPQATKAPEPTKAPLGPVAAAVESVKGLTGAEREKKLLEGARKEGSFELYSTVDVQTAQAIIDAFRKKYDGIDAKFFRASAGDLVSKLLTEERAGQHMWDMIDVPPEYVYTLDQEEGLFTAYDSPVRNELPETLRDPKGIWTSLYLNANVIAWNTQLVKPSEAPKTYADLLDPKWKGKISLDNNDYPWAYYVLKTMGQEKGMDFLQKLAAQKPQMVTGRTNQTNMLIAGEASVSVALYDYQEILQKKKGAPIDFAYVEPIRVENEPLMLSKNAQHPYAAMLFLDYVISKEGQTMMVNLTNRIPVRLDVAPLDASQAAVFKSKYILPPLDELGKSFKDIQVMYDKLFKGK